MDSDLRLIAQVTWVGRSSLEVVAEALTLDSAAGAWEPRLTARFVVVRPCDGDRTIVHRGVPD